MKSQELPKLLRVADILQGSKPVTDLAHPCIYFLIKDWQIVYVGQSVSIYARLQNHRTDKTKDWDRFAIIPAPIDMLDELELAYYEQFLPSQNKCKPTPARDRLRHKRQKKIYSTLPAPAKSPEETKKWLDHILGKPRKRQRKQSIGE